MTTVDLYSALKKKMRFQTSYGNLSIEDLASLSFDKITKVAKEFQDAHPSRSSNFDFGDEVSKESKAVEEQFVILKYFFDMKKAEQEAASKKQAEAILLRQKKEMAAQAKLAREAKAFETMSDEELDKILAQDSL